MRVVQAGFSDVDDGHCNTLTCGRSAIGLLDIGPAGLVEFLQSTTAIGDTNLREATADHAPATFKHTEDVAGWNGFPSGQWSN